MPTPCLLLSGLIDPDNLICAVPNVDLVLAEVSMMLFFDNKITYSIINNNVDDDNIIVIIISKIVQNFFHCEVIY